MCGGVAAGRKMVQVGRIRIFNAMYTKSTGAFFFIWAEFRKLDTCRGWPQ